MTPDKHTSRAIFKSQSMFVACIVFAILILALLGMITGYLFISGASSFNWSLITEAPTGNSHGQIGGMANGLVGTGVLILLASIVGIPLGMLCGIYLAEYDTGSWLTAPVRFVCDVLAGVPSIVVGILGYELLVVPFSSGKLLGLSLPFLTHLGINSANGWAGALALAFIMIPLVARTTEEMLRLIPNSYREASIALGATKAKTILRVVIPSARGSVITGIMLAIGRIAGETAPLLFTVMWSRHIPSKVSDVNHFFPSLTVQIYNWASDPSPELNRAARGGILMLIVLIFLLNLSIRFITRRKLPR